MKVSKRTREQAALICAVAASQGVWHHLLQDVPIGGVSEAALRLAQDAYSHAFEFDASWQEDYAEAEALLRTGWTP